MGGNHSLNNIFCQYFYFIICWNSCVILVYTKKRILSDFIEINYFYLIILSYYEAFQGSMLKKIIQMGQTGTS